MRELATPAYPSASLSMSEVFDVLGVATAGDRAGGGMFSRDALRALYWEARNRYAERRVLFPHSTTRVAAMFGKAGFDPRSYRNSYPDLAASIPSDEAAIVHFCRFSSDSTRHFPIELEAEGLSQIVRSRLRPSVKARILAGLFASYCVPWSALWTLDEAQFDKFWSHVISLLDGELRPFVVTGDSHCHIYCRLFERDGVYFVPLPFICYAASARGLVSRMSRSGAGIRLSRLAQALERAGARVPVIFKFGQVDVEFVFDFHRSQAGEIAFSEEKWRAFATTSAANYVDFVADHFQRQPLRVMGIFPPALADDVLRAGYANASVVASEGLQDLSELVAALRKLEFPDRRERTRLHLLFNEMVKAHAERRSIPFFDDFPFYAGADGQVNEAFIPTHRGTDHHLEKQSTRQTAIKIIKAVLSDMNYH